MSLFSNNTNIFNDKDYLNYKDNMNDKSKNYIFNDFNNANKWNKSECLSMSHPTFQVKDGTGWISNDGSLIEIDSKIRNGDRLTNKNVIHQFKQLNRLNRYHKDKNKYEVDVENILRPGLRKNIQKSVDTLVDHDFTHNTFHPTIKKDNKIQNPNHIIQENVCSNWIRGGNMTRDIIHNPTYLKKLGYKYNGKFWYK